MEKNTVIQKKSNLKYKKFTPEKDAKDNYWWWRPILYGVLTYKEASSLSPQDIMEANAALDIKLKQENDQYKAMFGK